MRDNTAKYREIAMLAIGTFLIFLSLFLIMYDRFELVKNEVIGEVELAIYNETHQDEEVVEEKSQEVEAYKLNSYDDILFNSRNEIIRMHQSWPRNKYWCSSEVGSKWSM